jgi:dihydrofolate reductase
MMQISIVVATALDGAIGKDNQLLWHLPKDLQYFKKLTSGHHILMGRKTFDSIGRPLPNRTNIIVSRSRASFPEGCVVVPDIHEGIAFAEEQGESELFIIGGGQVYRSAMHLADTVYHTRVHSCFPDADTYFEVPSTGWEIVSEEQYPADERHAYAFDLLVLKRS